MESKLIKIKKCSDAMMWYADHVGEEFVCYRETEFEYITRQPVLKEGDYPYLNIILKEDAIVLETDLG
jgi:hypothetical protein